MDGSHFDGLVRSAMGSRRSLMRAGLAAAAGWLGVSAATAKKRHKKKKRAKKPTPNAYGCLNVGQPCRGDSNACCSGICEGAKPKKGKKDTSVCVAHDAGICQAEFDICTTGVLHNCNLDNLECRCLLTTGNAGFCGDFTDVASSCQDCLKDSECEAQLGPGAACIVAGGLCASLCPDTGGTACVPACKGPEA